MHDASMWINELNNFLQTSFFPQTGLRMPNVTCRYFVPGDGDELEHPNMFSVATRGADVTLGDVRKSFPVPGRYHFRAMKAWKSTYCALCDACALAGRSACDRAHLRPQAPPPLTVPSLAPPRVRLATPRTARGRSVAGLELRHRCGCAVRW